MSAVIPINYVNAAASQRRAARKAYVKRQNGYCSHCAEPLTGEPSLQVQDQMYAYPEQAFPNGFLNNPIHLHHSHNSGLTLGAVHAECNAVLWFIYGE